MGRDCPPSAMHLGASNETNSDRLAAAPSRAASTIAGGSDSCPALRFLNVRQSASRIAPRNEDQEPTHPAARCSIARRLPIPGLRSPVRRLALGPSTARHRSDVRRAPASPRPRHLLRLRHVPPPLAVRIHRRARAHRPGGRDSSNSKHSPRSCNTPALLHAGAGTAKRALRLRPARHLHPRRPAPLLPRGRLAYSAATPPPL